MLGIIKTEPKRSLMFKCCDCGHTFKLMLMFLSRKCPLCGSKDIKPTIAKDENEYPWPVN